MNAENHPALLNMNCNVECISAIAAIRLFEHMRGQVREII